MPARANELRQGPLTMLLGYVLLGLVPVMVKSLKTIGWNAAHTVVARFAIACLCILFVVVHRRRWLEAHNKPLLLARGVLGAVAVLLFFTSVQLAGAGVGTLLNYTYPVWTNVLGVVVLRRRPLAAFWLLLATAVLGVYLVVHPDFGALRLGEVAGIVSAVFAGAAVLCIKRLRDTDNSLIIVWSFSAMGLLSALPIALWQSAGRVSELPWGDAMGWLYLVLTGLFSFVGHVYFTRGYKHTSLELGSLLALTVPVIAVCSGWLYLDEPVSPTFALGALLIVGSSALLGIYEGRQTTPQT